MGFQVVNGLTFKQFVEMPDGGRIIRADWGVQPAWDKQTPLHFWNHNIFRLDREGNVMWQVRRDEGEGRADWARMRELAEEHGNGDLYWSSLKTHVSCGHFRSPFITLILRFTDGTTNVERLTNMGPPAALWVKGATVICGTLDSMIYELNVDTGLATNKTPFGIREW